MIKVIILSCLGFNFNFAKCECIINQQDFFVLVKLLKLFY